MNLLYILDACALIAYLNDEPGADVVHELLQRLGDGSVSLLMHKMNLLEVYYGFYRERGQSIADEMLADMLGSGVRFLDSISDEVFLVAGRLKASHQISLGDAILLAQASASGAAVLTCDHHEFDAVEKVEPIIFEWIR
jgi:predicted nucleic acid-binding protein